jgi:hypothetical protein
MIEQILGISIGLIIACGVPVYMLIEVISQHKREVAELETRKNRMLKMLEKQWYI